MECTILYGYESVWNANFLEVRMRNGQFNFLVQGERAQSEFVFSRVSHSINTKILGSSSFRAILDNYVNNLIISNGTCKNTTLQYLTGVFVSNCFMA